MNDGLPTRLGNLLGGATENLGVRSPRAAARIWNRWVEIVGPATAAHSEPTSLREGVLRVRVDSPAWATEVGYLAEEIRGRANEAAGQPLVTEVRVWNGPGKMASRLPVPGSDKAPAEGPRERASDPAEALERARRAWARRRSR